MPTSAIELLEAGKAVVRIHVQANHPGDRKIAFTWIVSVAEALSLADVGLRERPGPRPAKTWHNSLSADHRRKLPLACHKIRICFRPIAGRHVARIKMHPASVRRDP